MAYYQVNCGHSAVKNGAKDPIRKFVDIAELVGLPIYWSPHGHYGQDFLEVPDDVETQNIIEGLLNESKLPFEIVDTIRY